MSEDISYQIAQEQERDFKRAEHDISTFLLKVETGMASKKDVEDAREALKIIGVNL